MKKSTLVGILSCTFVFVMLFSIAHPVSANPVNPLNGISEGEWSTGTVTAVKLEGTTYPGWLQLLDDEGVVLAVAAKICHPFRGGNFGWTADIRVLQSGIWTEVPTTMEWVPDKSGMFMACAYAPAPGMYALFGYYDPANVPIKAGEFVALDPEVCGYEGWNAYWWYHGEEYQDEFGWEPGYSLEVYLGENVEEFPIGETVTYEIVGDYPLPDFDFPQTGSTTSWDDGAIYTTFTDVSLDLVEEAELWPDFETELLIETQGCSYTIVWDSWDTYDGIWD